MLTDRQIVALQIFQSVIGNTSEGFFISRSKLTDSIKTLVNSALAYADIFLEQSGGNIDIGSIEQSFKDIDKKLEELSKMNQLLSAHNKALIGLLDSNVEVEGLVDGDIQEEERTALIQRGAIAWINGEPVYVVEED